jgi:hypothetical protein
MSFEAIHACFAVFHVRGGVVRGLIVRESTAPPPARAR